MLQSFDISTLADIRRFPGSRKYPWFNKEDLAAALEKNGIRYMHLEELGGRRKVQKDSGNSRWRNASFRGYADYMETAAFEKAVLKLEALALAQPTAYMCSEAVWWRCHRSMVSDYLKAKGWKVLHIMAAGKAEEHSYTSPARVVGDRVFYSDENLFDQ
ncbi:Fe-S cluster assembly protein HesB [Niabella ginsenosidivorans]|uniref:Fe-S cluster assembly protein HesB n=2 Tax=Niabella ginsenosidivorans TaxID=1176587 RepID=A0A1A9I0C8_9BACT|nr:Fe-S cluster assembly protein HesB [Niabella ginsenosidivorans]